LGWPTRWGWQSRLLGRLGRLGELIEAQQIFFLGFAQRYQMHQPYFDLFGRDIHLVKKMESVPNIKANLDEIKQVFLNLILNATQAMPRGGKLRIATSAHNDKVKIKIADTGPGISKENLDKVFEPFFTTKEPGEGTGLGLALVHTIIERYGGTIRVESEEEKETTFTIELPVIKGRY